MSDRFQAMDDRARAYAEEEAALRREDRRRIAEALTAKLSDELSAIEERQGIQAKLGWGTESPLQDRYAYMLEPGHTGGMTGIPTVDYWLAHGGHALAGGLESATGGAIGDVAEYFGFPETAAYSNAAERDFEQRYGDLGYYTGGAMELLAATPYGQGYSAATTAGRQVPGQIWRHQNSERLKYHPYSVPTRDEQLALQARSMRAIDRPDDVKARELQENIAAARHRRQTAFRNEQADADVRPRSFQIEEAEAFVEPPIFQRDGQLSYGSWGRPWDDQPIKGGFPYARNDTTSQTMQSQKPEPWQNLEPLTDERMGIRSSQIQSGRPSGLPPSRTESTTANSTATGPRKPPEFDLTSPNSPADEVQSAFDLRWQKGAEKPRQKQGGSGNDGGGGGGSGRPEVTDKELTKRIADTMPRDKAPPFGDKQKARVVQEIVEGRDPIEAFKGSGIPEKRIETYVKKVRRIMRTEQGRDYVMSAAKAGRPVASLAALSIANALTQQPEE